MKIKNLPKPIIIGGTVLILALASTLFFSETYLNFYIFSEHILHVINKWNPFIGFSVLGATVITMIAIVYKVFPPIYQKMKQWLEKEISEKFESIEKDIDNLKAERNTILATLNGYQISLDTHLVSEIQTAISLIGDKDISDIKSKCVFFAKKCKELNFSLKETYPKETKNKNKKTKLQGIISTLLKDALFIRTFLNKINKKEEMSSLSYVLIHKAVIIVKRYQTLLTDKTDETVDEFLELKSRFSERTKAAFSPENNIHFFRGGREIVDEIAVNMTPYPDSSTPNETTPLII